MESGLDSSTYHSAILGDTPWYWNVFHVHFFQIFIIRMGVAQVCHSFPRNPRNWFWSRYWHESMEHTSVSFKFDPSTGKRNDPGKELCQTGRLTCLHFGLFIPLVLKYIIISPRMSWSLFWFLSFREQVVLNYCFPRTTSPQDNNSVEVQNKVRSYSSSSRLRMQAALHFLKPFTIEEPKIGNSYRKYVQPHNL